MRWRFYPGCEVAVYAIACLDKMSHDDRIDRQQHVNSRRGWLSLFAYYELFFYVLKIIIPFRHVPAMHDDQVITQLARSIDEQWGDKIIFSRAAEFKDKQLFFCVWFGCCFMECIILLVLYWMWLEGQEGNCVRCSPPSVQRRGTDAPPMTNRLR